MINYQPLEPELTFVKIIEVTNGEDYIDRFYGYFKTKEDFQNSVMRNLSLTDIDHIEFYYQTKEGVEKEFVIRQISGKKDWCEWAVYHLSECIFNFGCTRDQFIETFEKQLKIKMKM